MIEMYGVCIFLGILLVYTINRLYLKKTNALIDLDNLIIYIYVSAFLGGKLIYFLFDSHFLDFDFSFNILYGGFSLLGASFFSVLALLSYNKKHNIAHILNSFFPISILFLHAFGRIGCFFSGCCGGDFYGFSLYIPVILFYLFLALFGLYVYYIHHVTSFYSGLLYYTSGVFLERFLFDIYRYDSIMTCFFFTKYQLFALFYILLSFFCIMIFLILKNKKIYLLKK